MLISVVLSSQGASEEELKRMEKEVREQEQLLTGYQQENERLYKELKQMQAKEKSNEARMFSDNQKLGKESLSCFFVCSREDDQREGFPLPHNNFLKFINSFVSCCESYFNFLLIEALASRYSN